MKIHRARLLLVGCALLATACKNESADSPGVAEGPIVARVGDREVTVAYYEERLEKMERRFLPDTLDMAGRKEFLNFIINKELMALKAESIGLGESENIRASLETMENTLMLQAAVDQVTAGMDSVAEDDIQAFYENMKTQRLSKHILVDTKQMADELHNALMQGADFDSLVDVHSTVPRLDSTGGELPIAQRAMFGWVEFGKATPIVENAIYGGPMNQAAEPIQTPYGWHVFLPVSTRARRQPPYEEARDLIRQQIAGRRKRAATEAYYDRILDDRGYEIDQAALDLVYSKLPEDQAEAPDVSLEVKPVIPFTYEERETTLFELDGKAFTVGDFSDKYDFTNWGQRPKRQFGTHGITLFIRDEWLQDLRRERAIADGVAELPSLVADLKTRREEAMVNALHVELVQQQLPEPTEEELVAFFNEHPDHYIDHEKRTCNLIFHPRERVVRRAHQEIVDGADFVETAIRYNDSAIEPEHVRTAAFTRTDTKHADIAEVAFGLDLNQYSEPFKVSSGENKGWIVLQVHQIVAEKPFEYEDVEEFVRRDWQSEWMEERLNGLLEEWRTEFSLAIFEDVLANAEVRRDDVFVPQSSGSTVSHEPGAGDTN